MYERYLGNLLSLPELMVLIHPKFYEDYCINNDPRGKRKFEPEIFTSATRCQSKLLWGYDCKVQYSIKFQSDHLWPYALGGATVSENKKILCEIHNSFKTSDIHLFPWEEGLPSWYSQIIESIKKILL